MSDSSLATSNNNITTNRFLLRFVSLFFNRNRNRNRSRPTIDQREVKQSPAAMSDLEIMKEVEVEVVVVVDDDVATMIKKAVKEINFGGWEEKEAAAMEIKRLAKSDVGTRKRLAELRVIPPLVAMIVESSVDDRCRILAVEALIELANGNFRNKKLIVEAGLLSNLPKFSHTESITADRHFTALLFSISSLAESQYPISSRHMLPFLIKILNTEQIGEEVKLTTLATLHNLSTKLENTKTIATSGAVHTLLISSTNKTASERALATLGNLVLSSSGKKAIEDDPLVPEVLIEILTWDDNQKCQELATYLLMVIAHRSRIQREKMEGLGIVPLLLEVALLGSPLTRKRALKLLQWFKDEKTMRMGVHSGPQARRFALSSGAEDEEESNERRKALKKMVKQSLDKNMELIMMRANGEKALVASSSSRSLPY